MKFYTDSWFSMIYTPNEFQANLHILRLQSSAAWKPLVFWLWNLHHWIWRKKLFPKHIQLFKFGLFWKNPNFLNYHNLWKFWFFQNNPNLKSWICFGNDFSRRIQWCRFQSQKINGFQMAELQSRRICKLAWNFHGQKSMLK